MGQILLLFLILLWLAAWAIEKAFFSRPARWWRSGLIALGLLVLLHADAAIGYFIEYRPAVKDAGDGQVLKHVVADGFLDGRGSTLPLDIRRTEPGLVLFKKDYPFKYVEMRSASASRSRLLTSYGIANSANWTYVHFYKASASSPECEKFEALPDATHFREKYGIPASECIAAKQTRDPISRYEALESPSHKLNPNSPFLVVGHERLLLDRQSGEKIARCAAIALRPQISKFIFARLLHASHNPRCNGDFFPLIASAIQPNMSR